MNSDNIYSLSNIILSHMLKCGKYPNFSDFNNPVNYVKIKNYINNILNTQYADDIIVEIIEIINNNIQTIY